MPTTRSQGNPLLPMNPNPKGLLHPNYTMIEPVCTGNLDKDWEDINDVPPLI